MTLLSCVIRSFRSANVTRVNFFVLDVEGGEHSVLTTIDWATVQFDVLVIETEPEYRPEGNFERIQSFLGARGYSCLPGFETVGRNSWFVRNDFRPSQRPGLAEGCFQGLDHSRRKTHPGQATCTRKKRMEKQQANPGSTGSGAV